MEVKKPDCVKDIFLVRLRGNMLQLSQQGRHTWRSRHSENCRNRNRQRK